MTDVLRVQLVSTATADSPGSMLAYGGELVAAFAEYVPDVELRTTWLARRVSRSASGRRLQMVAFVGKAMAAKPDCDLWHVLDGSRAFLGTALRKRPVLITAHDFIPLLADCGEFAGVLRQGLAARFVWRMNLRSLSRADWVVADSESTARDLHRLATVREERCSVVKLPVRGSLLRHRGTEGETNREEGLVLHVGNDAFYKNRGQVLRIFARLDRGSARRLVMIGPRLDPELQRLSRELGIAELISCKEGVNDEEVASWYARASLMLFPSLYEGYGWPVIEAMAFGLPVLASERGSLPELLGPCAPGIPPGATDQWVARAEALLKSAPAREELGARCRAHAETFSRRRFAEEMRWAYLKVVGRDPSRA